jgi:hypothetical protein
VPLPPVAGLVSALGPVPVAQPVAAEAVLLPLQPLVQQELPP